METDRNGARNSSKYLITEGFAEWGMLFVLAPLASLSLAGQEHGRTIPLPDIDPRRRDQNYAVQRPPGVAPTIQSEPRWLALELRLRGTERKARRAKCNALNG
jgi:hypothetical protein